MEILKAIVAFISAVVKLPNFADVTATKAWLTTLIDPVATVLGLLVSQINTTGAAEIPLPDGSVVMIYQTDDGWYTMSQDHQSRLCSAAAPEANGKWLEIFKTLLPLFVQYVLPFLVKTDPEPTPTPAPTPVV